MISIAASFMVFSLSTATQHTASNFAKGLMHVKARPTFTSEDAQNPEDKMTDLTHRKIQLLKRRKELMARLHHIEHELDAPVPQDFSDQATEREEDEVLEGLGAAGITELKGIEAALTRIEDDSYGTCLKCGADIPEARLDLVPHAGLCAACAA
jgi:RNA polymerase-binding transcription factor DksA